MIFQAEKLKHSTENEEFGVILMNNTFDKGVEDSFDMACYQIIVDLEKGAPEVKHIILNE